MEHQNRPTAIDLIDLLGLSNRNPDYKTSNAIFYGPTPWIAPLAYAHVIFSPAVEAHISQISEALKIPQFWKEFLRRQNGADLFSGALYLYGVIPRGEPLNRSSLRTEKPFNIEWRNCDSIFKDKGIWLLVGSYGYNRTLLLVNRESGEARLADDSGNTISDVGFTIDQWISNEISRLSRLFDASGRLITDSAQTLPPRRN